MKKQILPFVFLLLVGCSSDSEKSNLESLVHEFEVSLIENRDSITYNRPAPTDVESLINKNNPYDSEGVLIWEINKRIDTQVESILSNPESNFTTDLEPFINAELKTLKVVDSLSNDETILLKVLNVTFFPPLST